MDQVVLSQDGETELGPQSDSWMVRGIPVQRVMQVRQPDGSRESVTYLERVPTRSEHFGPALDQWALEHRLTCLAMADSHLACWELLLLIPLEASERFAFLLALRLTPVELLSEWRSCLHEAEMLVRHAHAQTEQAIRLLQKRLAHHLSHVFVAPKARA